MMINRQMRRRVAAITGLTLAAAPALAMPARPALILPASLSAKAEAAGHFLGRHDYEFAMLMMVKAAGMLGGDSAPAALPWNALDKSASITLSAADRTATSGSTAQGIRGKTSQSVGKFLFEVTLDNRVSGDYVSIGVATAGASLSNAFGTSGSTVLASDASIYKDGGFNANTSFGNLNTSGTVVCVAVDFTAGLVWFAKNGTYFGSPSGGTGGVAFSGPAPLYPVGFCSLSAGGEIFTINTGQGVFVYTPPAGFLAWG